MSKAESARKKLRIEEEQVEGEDSTATTASIAKAASATAVGIPEIQSPDRTQKPETEIETDEVIPPLKELEDFGEIYSEKYMKECSTMIEQQDFHKHREPREKVVTEDMLEPIQMAVKKMAEPRRPKGWEKEFFKFLQEKQKIIVEKMGPEEFLNCSIIRVRMRVDSVI